MPGFIDSIKALYTPKTLPPPLSLWGMLGAFATFLISYGFIIPYIEKHFPLPIPKEVQGLLIFALTFFLYVLSQWKELFPYFKNSGFRAGFVTWFLALPLVMAWASVVEYLMENLLGYSGKEQSAVLAIKKGSSDPFTFAILIFFIALVVPVMEEILFRGYLQNWLRNYLKAWPAIVLTSAIFAFFHYTPDQGGSNITILSSLFILSCFLGWLVERTGSLRSSIALHATFNTMSIIFILLKDGQ